MKKSIALILIFASFYCSAQQYQYLQNVKNKDSVTANKAIIYGSFIQRLAFLSGGFPQEIRIIDINTNEIYSFNVKPAYKSAKENSFIYFVKPGTYAILNYWWTQSKWYGGKFFTEPIFKGLDSKDSLKMGAIKKNDLSRFIFSVEDNSITYLGTWHFDTGIVSFTDNQKDLNNKLQNKFTKIDFEKSKLGIPN